MSENLDIKNESKNKFILFLKDNFKKLVTLIIIILIYLVDFYYEIII